MKRGRKPIQDQLTKLKMSRQRKWHLRNRRKVTEISRRYEHSDKGKATRKAYANKLKKESK